MNRILSYVNLAVMYSNGHHRILSSYWRYIGSRPIYDYLRGYLILTDADYRGLP